MNKKLRHLHQGNSTKQAKRFLKKRTVSTISRDKKKRNNKKKSASTSRRFYQASKETPKKMNG